MTEGRDVLTCCFAYFTTELRDIYLCDAFWCGEGCSLAGVAGPPPTHTHTHRPTPSCTPHQWGCCVSTSETSGRHVHLSRTLTGHLFAYTLPTPLIPCWLKNCQKFSKLIWQHHTVLQTCQLLIHDVNVFFHHIPKVLYRIEIWWLISQWPYG